MRSPSAGFVVLLTTTLVFQFIKPVCAFTSTNTAYSTSTHFYPTQTQNFQEFPKKTANIVESCLRHRLVLAKSGNNLEDSETPSSFWLVSLLLPLWLVFVSNQWSRSAIYYLVDFSDGADPFRAMNVDLSFSESQYGLLASVAFTTLFAVCSLVAGVASDRYNRKVLTIASAAAWSVATLGTSLSSSYSEVVLWRIAMGLACAFSTPTAYTLLQQQVPENNRALASSLYSTGVALGGGLAALSVLLDTSLGWRNSLLAISFFGFGSAGLSSLLLPNDPKEESTNDGKSKDNSIEEAGNFPTIVEEVSEVVSTSRVQWLFLASFLRFSCGLSIGVWSAPYFRMTFPENEANYAFAQALITAVCGISSGLLGGAIADWISTKSEGSSDPVGKQLWVPVIGCILAAPAWYLSIHSEWSFETSMTWLAVEFLVAEVWFGPTVNVLQSTVGPKIGGTAQGLFTLTGAIGNLAPSLLGYLYGQAAGVESSSALGDILGNTVSAGYIASAVCFAVSAQLEPPQQEND